MRQPIRTDYNPRHWRFERTCEGFYPEPEVSNTGKIVAIIVVVMLIIGVMTW